MTDIGPAEHLDSLHHGGLRDLGGNYSKLKVVTQGIHVSHKSDIPSGVSDQTQKLEKVTSVQYISRFCIMDHPGINVGSCRIH